MNDNIIMSGIAHKFTDIEISDIITLFGEDPMIAILEDGTSKDRHRAERRKATAHHHKHLEEIACYYPSKDSNKKNLKKRCRMSKEWYADPDFRKDTERAELREAWNIVSYEERRKAFFKEVDKFLNEDEYGYDDSGCEYPSLSEVFVVPNNVSEVRVVTDDFGVEWDFSDLEEILPF